MAENNDDKYLMEHNYDGIQEYDNPLPAWWLITFFGTIIFGFHYWIHYEFGGGKTLKDELKINLAAVRALSPNSDNVDKEETLAALVSDSAALAKGKEVYVAKCAACHGPEMQGLIGPNLVDEYWIHGGKLVDIAVVVRKGVLDKGMPNWETQLKDAEIQSVTAYVYAARGSKPANPKPPQGEKIVE